MVFGTELLQHSGCFFFLLCVSLIWMATRNLITSLYVKVGYWASVLSSMLGKEWNFGQITIRERFENAGRRVCMTKLHSVCAGSHLFPCSINQLAWLAFWLSSPWRESQACVGCVPLFLVNSETFGEEIVT